jgi:pantoate--beta-alanine ligase
MYPQATRSRYYDLGELETVFEGKYRPGHFQGVCQIVHLLLSIVTPHQLFMGQKDYQQCMVIKRLLEIIGSKTELNIVNTVREDSGLAMSSRNLRLSTDDKKKATAIYKLLQYIKDNYKKGPVIDLEKYGKDYLLQNGFEQVDYISLVNASNLKAVTDDEKPQLLVALIAAWIGGIRLIDNEVLRV